MSRHRYNYSHCNQEKALLSCRIWLTKVKKCLGYETMYPENPTAPHSISFSPSFSFQLKLSLRVTHFTHVTSKPKSWQPYKKHFLSSPSNFETHHRIFPNIYRPQLHPHHPDYAPQNEKQIERRRGWRGIFHRTTCAETSKARR